MSRTRRTFTQRCRELMRWMSDNFYNFCVTAVWTIGPIMLGRIIFEGYSYIPVGIPALAIALQVSVIAAYTVFAISAAVVLGVGLYSLYKHFTADNAPQNSAEVAVPVTAVAIKQNSQHPEIRHGRSANWTPYARITRTQSESDLTRSIGTMEPEVARVSNIGETRTPNVKCD